MANKAIIVSAMKCATSFQELSQPRRFPDMESAYSYIRGQAEKEKEKDNGNGIKSIDDRLADDGVLAIDFKNGFILYRVDKL